MKTQIYFVLGPTASGKSKFALSLANKLNGEIINADSMQIYHELSILTARPTINDQKKINHHLYIGYQLQKRAKQELLLGDIGTTEVKKNRKE